MTLTDTDVVEFLPSAIILRENYFEQNRTQLNKGIVLQLWFLL